MTSTSSSTRFDHRDHAVVPWISLSSRSSTGEANLTGVSLPSSQSAAHDVTSGSEHDQPQQQYSFHTSSPPHRSQSCKILSLLATRERVGIQSSSLSSALLGVSVSRVGWLQEGRNVTTKSLAMSGAWYVPLRIYYRTSLSLCICLFEVMDGCPPTGLLLALLLYHVRCTLKVLTHLFSLIPTFTHSPTLLLEQEQTTNAKYDTGNRTRNTCIECFDG